MSTPVLDLTKLLIACQSITPNDGGCQSLIATRLKNAGFTLEHFPAGNVQNLYATRGDAKYPCLVFVGHTDVVPTGPLEQWKFPPFTPIIEGELLYGRGAADMKSGVAAMVVACERFFERYPDAPLRVGILLTSDEEGPAVDGIQHVIEILKQRNEEIDYCIVGEPSSVHVLGDTIKVGRRGSLTGSLKIHGQQGHIAYPELADNPIHRTVPLLQALMNYTWDDNHNPEFPATQFQCSNIHAGTGASNVIPSNLKIDFNLRFAPPLTADVLKQKIKECIETFSISYILEFAKASHPFITQPGPLRAAVESAVKEVLNVTSQSSTAGGTSDGRFLATMGAEVVELGVINASIHHINEHVCVADIERLTATYLRVLERITMSSRKRGLGEIPPNLN